MVTYVRLPAESDLNRQLNTYIIRIHISRNTTPIHWTIGSSRNIIQQISYVRPRPAVGTVSQAYVERIFSVCGLLTSWHRNRMNKKCVCATN